MFTPKQIEKLVQAVEDSHWLFIARFIGTKYVPSDVLSSLRKLGFVKTKSLTEKAFRTGAKFEGSLDKNQKVAIDIVEQRAVEGILNLSGRISGDVRRLAAESTMMLRHQQGKRVAKEFLKSFLKLSQSWTNGFDRVADYVVHEAYDLGRALAIESANGGDAEVYKHVYDKACKHCVHLYRKPSGEPRVFKLNDLLINGTNIGRKTNEWKPVIGPTHPYCRCDVVHVPLGWAWSKKTKRFAPLLSGRAKRIRKRLKVKVTIT